MSKTASAADGEHKGRCRGQSVIIDVPIEPQVQEGEEFVQFQEGMDASSRKIGPRVMAEKIAGSGVFFRAFVKASKSDRVLLFFPADAEECILEWVYKTSSRLYRSSSTTKSSWKYQGNGAWKVTENSKKPKGCGKAKRRRHATIRSQSGNGSDTAPATLHEAAGFKEMDGPAFPEISTPSENLPLGRSIGAPHEASPLSRWFHHHLALVRDRDLQGFDKHEPAILRSAHLDHQQAATPNASLGDGACHSSQRLEEALHSVDSTECRVSDRNVRLSCTGLDDTLGQHRQDKKSDYACELRFTERDFDDDGSNSDNPGQHSSPSGSACDVAPAVKKRVFGAIHASACDNSVTGETGVTGSPNASASDREDTHMSFKFNARQLRLSTVASLSATSCQAFHGCG